MHIPLIPALLALTTLLPTVVLGDFHILTANCQNQSFRNKRSVDDTGVDAGLDADAASPAILARDPRGFEHPLRWQSDGSSKKVNLIPSQKLNGNDRCDYLNNVENLNIETLPGGNGEAFSAREFCGEDLNFYKTDRNTWEVWRRNAKPGVKFGECYEDKTLFVCKLFGVGYRNSCSWTRQYVCPMSLCK